MTNSEKPVPNTFMTCDGESPLQKPATIGNLREGYKPGKPEGVARPVQMPIPPQAPGVGDSQKK